MKIKYVTMTVLASALLLSSNAFSAVKYFSPFMPQSDAKLMQLLFDTTPGSMTQDQFNQVVKDTTDKYQALAAGHGATLTVEAAWDDAEVNAYADQDGTKWSVHFFGGLARHPAMTVDGMTLVVCHELDHHFGGFPFFSGGNSWGAVEGQADYGATHFCARYVWKDDLAGNAAAAQTVPAVAKTACDAAWTDQNDRNLCYRTAQAGVVLGTVLASISGDGSAKPDLATPDSSVVTETFEDHPQAQCRLDTYFQGALCAALPWDMTVIPGKDNPAGEQSLDAQKEAFKYSCSKENQPSGARPACWFHEM